jgi:RNA polymerase sigma-32 factor
MPKFDSVMVAPRLDAALPILTTEPGLTQCLEEIRRSERQEECMLAKRWRE